MGYAGATAIVQDYCNALFDALFHILPLGRDLDRIEATPARIDTLHWDPAAQAALERHLEQIPFLTRISAAKHAREQVEANARAAGSTIVTAASVAATLTKPIAVGA